MKLTVAATGDPVLVYDNEAIEEVGSVDPKLSTVTEYDPGASPSMVYEPVLSVMEYPAI